MNEEPKPFEEVVKPVMAWLARNKHPKPESPAPVGLFHCNFVPVGELDKKVQCHG